MPTRPATWPRRCGRPRRQVESPRQSPSRSDWEPAATRGKPGVDHDFQIHNALMELQYLVEGNKASSTRHHTKHTHTHIYIYIYKHVHMHACTHVRTVGDDAKSFRISSIVHMICSSWSALVSVWSLVSVRSCTPSLNTS